MRNQSRLTFAHIIFFVLAGLSVAFAIPPAFAQEDLFLQTKPDPNLPPVLQKQLEKPENIQTYANAFYQRCLGQQRILLEGDDKKTFCACTSAKISQEVSIEDVMAMQSDTQTARQLRNLVMINIYSPCMEDPIYDITYHSCINDASIRKSLRFYRAVCQCRAQGMEEYWKSDGLRVVTARNSSRDFKDDLLLRFFLGHEFDSESEAVMQRCILQKENGW